jgi:exopolysaccharide production protein ExoY
MHTSRTDLANCPVEPDQSYWSEEGDDARTRIAQAPAGASETVLITNSRAAATARFRPGEGFGGTRLPVRHSAGAPSNPAARARDIVCALFLIILLLPLMLLLALLIVLCDPGSPVFAHVRVGRNGQPFKCYKLRTMYCDAETRLIALLATQPAMRREWETSYKLSRDPRVTPLGDFLRKSSLDELPQLFNVLGGSMTLVGPRPVVRDELKHYGRHALHYLSMKPGLTGLWQVTGRSEVSYRRRVATDLLYARRQSLMLDFRILIATVPAVLAGKGAW